MVDGGRTQMILLIQIQNLSFHYFEFVKPIEDILDSTSLRYESIHYTNITSEHITKAEKIIICGTSLKDNSFLSDIEKFSWIKETQKPILGICGGMHILGRIYDEPLVQTKEIGLNQIIYQKQFLHETGEKEVYELHNYCIKPELFEILATSENCVQVIKHPDKPHYGVLFHPEARSKNIIIDFIKK